MVSRLVSKKMRAVPQRDTQPELALRKQLFRYGLRYRTHVRGLPGTPDVAFMRERVAVFVHGCYWHRHQDCPRATTPKSNVSFWYQKFSENQQRDAVNRTKLQQLGWRVFEAWECELSNNSFLVAGRVKRAVALRKGKVVAPS